MQEYMQKTPHQTQAIFFTNLGTTDLNKLEYLNTIFTGEIVLLPHLYMHKYYKRIFTMNSEL